MTGKGENIARVASIPTQLRLSRTAWRQRGYAVARYNRVRLTVEELRALGGELAVAAYNEGIRTGERERRLAMARAREG